MSFFWMILINSKNNIGIACRVKKRVKKVALNRKKKYET